MVVSFRDSVNEILTVEPPFNGRGGRWIVTLRRLPADNAQTFTNSPILEVVRQDFTGLGCHLCRVVLKCLDLRRKVDRTTLIVGKNLFIIGKMIGDVPLLLLFTKILEELTMIEPEIRGLRMSRWDFLGDLEYQVPGSSWRHTRQLVVGH